MGLFIDFSYVKANADFAAVLAEYNVELTGTGAERRARCPFHDDQRPSLSVNLEEKVFQCHAASCGEKGNVLDFVRALDGGDLRSAAQTIAKISGSDLAPAKPTRVKKPARNGDASNGSRHVEAAEKKQAEEHRRRDGNEPLTFNKPLGFELKLDPCHPYGGERGFPNTTIEGFGMGFCNRGSMKDRWCISIHNSTGELIGYIGRSVTVADKPKWVLPSKFAKSFELFNLHRVPDETHHVVIVEGASDAIRLHELGKPAVAIFGTTMSVEQVELLHRNGISEITVILDAEAGDASDRLVLQLARDFFVRSVDLPPGTDPASVNEGFILGEVVPV